MKRHADRYWQFTLLLDNGATMTFGLSAPTRQSAARTALTRAGRVYFRSSSAALDEIPAPEARPVPHPA